MLLLLLLLLYCKVKSHHLIIVHDISSIYYFSLVKKSFLNVFLGLLGLFRSVRPRPVQSPSVYPDDRASGPTRA